MPVTVVLLAAGYGTRLYPLTKDTPKALLPLGEGVILDAIIRTLPDVPEGKRCVLVTNTLFADRFRAWQRARDVNIQIVDDGTRNPEGRLGAVRDLELARTQTGDLNDLLVIGTDNLFDWSVAEFVATAKRYWPSASVALWEAPRLEAARQFGVVKREPSSRIISFVEKSPQPSSKEVALCVYYFPQPMVFRIRQFLDEGQNGDAPGHLIAWLLERESVYGVPMTGAWYDIGSIEAYRTVVNIWGSPAVSKRLKLQG